MDSGAVNFFTGFTVCIGMLIVLIELVIMCFIGLISRKEKNMSFQKQIERGASLLDEKIPTWIDKQDLLWLNLMSPCMCVLGQAEEIGEYWETLSKLFPGKTEEELNILAYEHGFNIKLPKYRDISEKEYQDYTDLTTAWKIFIAERRKTLEACVPSNTIEQVL